MNKLHKEAAEGGRSVCGVALVRFNPNQPFVWRENTKNAHIVDYLLRTYTSVCDVCFSPIEILGALEL